MMEPTRREQLLNLAEHVLERDGLEEFGVGALAREAGVKAPSLYKHFDGIDDIRNALVARGLRRFAAALTAGDECTSPSDPGTRGATFVNAYRAYARASPALYRLMTEYPLDRARLEPGAEDAAMAPLLALLGEDAREHHRARAAWAWMHGLVTLEIAARFPDDADVDAAWQVLKTTLDAWAAPTV
jgi:AcrR family transcriptional regulator